MHDRRNFILMLMVFGLFVGTIVSQSAVPEAVIHYPDLIVYGGKIISMDDSSLGPDAGSTFSAMAVRDGKILALGESQTILSYAGPQTQVLDLKGRLVIPGIINSHLHIHDQILNEWFNENPVRARTAVGAFNISGQTKEELLHRIEVTLRENVSNLERDKWAFLYLPNGPRGTGTGLGVGFLQERPISIERLDELSPENPVILASHPSYVINTRARQILKEMYGVEPNFDETDHHGFAPMGVEYRRSAIVDTYFSDKLEVLAEEVILPGLQKAASQGMTTFSSHITGINNFNAYIHLLRKNGRLPIRFGYSTYTGFQPNPSEATGFYLRLGDRAGYGNDYFWSTGVGVSNLDSGPPMICTSIDLPAEQKQREWCRIAPGTQYHQAIYNILINRGRLALGHNYGDKSADYFMDLVEKAISEEPSITLEYVRSRRISMDHCGLYPRPDQLPRMKKLGIMLSCGAADVFDRTYPWLESTYGLDKAQWIAPARNILDAGVTLTFETEFGIENGLISRMVPFITRKNSDGKVVAADQAIDRVSALKMATVWASEFMMRETVLGSLKPGYWADFLVLNQDYFTVPLQQLDRTIPLMTVVGGETVFLRESLAQEWNEAPVGVQFKYTFEE